MKQCFACGTDVPGPGWRCSACGSSPPSINGFLAFSPDLAEGDAGYRPEYHAALFELETAHFWYRARNRLITWALDAWFPDIRSMLEIGCGTGVVLVGIGSRFPETRIAGSELFATALPLAARRVPSATLFQMDARNIPFRDEYDVVGAFDVLEHIEEDERVLAQMWKAIAPGGGLLVTVPMHRFIWSAHDEFSCHVRRYARREMERKVAAAGFTVLLSTGFVSLLLPVLIARRMMRWRNVAADPLADLRLPRWVNVVCERTMAIERRLIQAGVRFPMGGSLLVVARKDAPDRSPRRTEEEEEERHVVRR
jgi:trans-aconitate methyltransferase